MFDFDEIPKLDRQGLREFGLVTGGIFAGLFGLLLPLLFRHSFPAWPWVVATIFASLALLTPRSLGPVYQIWMRIGLVLGLINTRIILGLIFYGLFMPMGLIMRGVVKRDPMHRSWDTKPNSYRILSPDRPSKSMEKPY
ncbi:MAG: SxtJ family membrane protein [Geitlerinemataceae cyanobacterium]